MGDSSDNFREHNHAATAATAAAFYYEHPAKCWTPGVRSSSTSTSICSSSSSSHHSAEQTGKKLWSYLLRPYLCRPLRQWYCECHCQHGTWISSQRHLRNGVTVSSRRKHRSH